MTMIEIMSTSIATRSGIRDLATATTTLIATTGLDKSNPASPVPARVFYRRLSLRRAAPACNM